MRPNGKKNNNNKAAGADPSELQANANAWYEMFVAAVEEMMADRRKAGQPVNAAYQIGYFILFANVFVELELYPDEVKKQMIKIYTNVCSEYIDRITLVDIINHFEEMYLIVGLGLTEEEADSIGFGTPNAMDKAAEVRAAKKRDPQETVEGQKRYIAAMEMELQGPDTDTEKIADCMMIASQHISKTIDLISSLGE